MDNNISRKPLFYLTTSLNIGGTELFLATLARHFRSRFDITVGFLRERGRLGDELAREGITVEQFADPRRLVRHLKERRYPLVHTFLYWGNVMGRVAGHFAGVPAVISTQQAVDDWKRWYHILYDRLTRRWCDVLIANSIAARERMIRREGFDERRVRVVHNGVDLHRFSVADGQAVLRARIGIPDNAFVSACITRLHYDKGVDFIPAIASKSPGTVFLIAGDGPSAERLRADVEGRGLAGRFVFLGWRKDVPELLKASDVFLLPSREESFPQAALEAMAAGRPVVAADVGGVRELITDGAEGYLITRGDIDGFSTALNRLDGDRARCSQMGHQARVTSEEFSLDLMLGKIEKIYDECLSSINT